MIALQVFRVAVLVLVLGLVAFTVSAGVSIDSIDKDIHDDWTVIQSSLNSTRWYTCTASRLKDAELNSQEG